MNNVHTPRYDVGSRARLVCISRRGRSTDRPTGLFPITGTAPATLSRYRARVGERVRPAREGKGGPDTEALFVSASVDCRRRCSSPFAPLCPICFTRVSPRNRVIRVRESPVQQGRGDRNVSRVKNSTDLLGCNSPPFIPPIADQEASERVAHDATGVTLRRSNKSVFDENVVNKIRNSRMANKLFFSTLNLYK